MLHDHDVFYLNPGDFRICNAPCSQTLDLRIHTWNLWETDVEAYDVYVIAYNRETDHFSHHIYKSENYKGFRVSNVSLEAFRHNIEEIYKDFPNNYSLAIMICYGCSLAHFNIL